MNPKSRITFLMTLVWAMMFLAGCAEPRNDRVYQVSTLQALMLGLYDGQTTVAKLRQQGDHGIGTFNALDGEMMLLDGKVYRISADGKVAVVKPETKTPFACVTHFEADEKFPLSGGRDYGQLKQALDAWLPTTNLPYAVRITGTFQYVKTRSVPKQKKPYPPLTEVTKTQPTFEFKNVKGTMVGFRLPGYLAGVNLKGYHLHFLTKDRKGGGHVLAFNAKDAIVEVDTCTELLLTLPQAKAFAKINLADVKEEDLQKVEAKDAAAAPPKKMTNDQILKAH